MYLCVCLHYLCVHACIYECISFFVCVCACATKIIFPGFIVWVSEVEVERGSSGTWEGVYIYNSQKLKGTPKRTLLHNFCIFDLLMFYFTLMLCQFFCTIFCRNICCSSEGNRCSSALLGFLHRYEVWNDPPKTPSVCYLGTKSGG